VDAGSLIRRVLGERGDLRRIRFREGSRSIECFVPDDSIWIAVKDNLLLHEYERMGINLNAVRGTVLDAGAHAGLFTLRAAVNAERVIALEPNPDMYAILRMNVARNGVQNVETLSRALWTDSGHIDLVEGAHSAATSVFATGQRRFRVEAATIEDVLAGVGQVDLLKLDIEGAEFGVLRSTSPETRERISAIAAELHLNGRPAELPELVQHLLSCGYRVSVLEQPLHYWRDSMVHTLRSWRNLESQTSLKVAVIAIYSLAAAARMLAFRVEADPPELKFLYAVRDR
jgi:FkbM family methyltransferase